MKKRLLALLLTVCMILSLAPAVMAAEVTSLSGSGTEADPYMINNIDDLKFFRDSVNAGETTYNAGSVQAQIGDTYYTTLTAAFDAAEDEDTIVVLGDAALSSTITIPAGMSVTLDLNGNTVSMVYAENISANHEMIKNLGNLTIADSVGEGKLSYTYTGANAGTSYAANTITTEPGSTLTVTGGTIENLTYDSGTIAYAIDGRTNGGAGDVSVIIEDGIITSERQAIRIFANSTTCTGSLSIYSGEITGRVIMQNANATANKATLEITGGTFNPNAYKSDVLYVGGSNSATIDIAASVSGGTFNGEITQTHVTGFISGGFFAVAPDDSYIAEGCEAVYDEAWEAYTIAPVAGSVASIGNVGYATLSAAIEAVQDGETIFLLTDIDLTEEPAAQPDGLLRVQNKEEMFTIEGTGHSISGGGLRFVGGECWLTDIVFTDCVGGVWGIVEFEDGASGWIDGCEFIDNNTKNCVDIGSDIEAGDIIITDCLFDGNTCSTAIINATASVSAMISRCDFIDNTAAISVIYAADDATVMGNYFSDNTLTGSNANKAAVLAGPWEAGTYEIQIIHNAFLDTAAPSVWAEIFSGAETSYDLCGNYWVDGSAPVKGEDYNVTGEPEICVDEYANKYTRNSSGCGVDTFFNSFVDIKAGSFYEDAVDWAVSEGITNGTTATTFSPDKACTRAEIVTFLWRACGQPEPTGSECVFTDVTPNAYYFDAVLWAVEEGITNGTSATTFSPDKTCTRAESVTFLWRAAGKEAPESKTCNFTDVPANAYYTDAVLWAVENNITKGTSATTFKPDLECSRAQIVTFLYRAYN